MRDLPCRAKAAHRDVNQTPLFLLVGVEKLHQQLRAQRPRAQRVHANLLARMHDRQLASQRQHRSLAGGVGDLGCRCAQPRHERRCVDDAPSPCAAQCRNAMLAPQKNPFALTFIVRSQTPSSVDTTSSSRLSMIRRC